MCRGNISRHLPRFEKCKDAGMILSTVRTKREHQGLWENTALSNCEGELDPSHPSSAILLTFSSKEYAKIQSLKTLWNIQCEINPISLQLIFPLIDFAIGGGENNNDDIVHQHTKVRPWQKINFHLFKSLNVEIHEDWWSQFCVGVMEEFPWLSPQERRAVLGRHRLVDRFCQGVYIGPGSNKTLLQCLRESINTTSQCL